MKRAGFPHLVCLFALAFVAVLDAGAVEVGDPAEGRRKAARCQGCHGTDGIARMPNVPHIAGESEIYLVKQLEAFRTGQRQDPQMSIMAKDLSDADIADLAAYYARIEISARVPESLR
ncbi:MAG TPA: cytochrome c [Alphaproteobacteria bacterium]